MVLALTHTNFYQNFFALSFAALPQLPHGPKTDFDTQSPPFFDYLGKPTSESPPQVHSYSLIRQLFGKVWQKTTEVVNAFFQSSCAYGLISGSGASLATNNPLPMLFGLSGCLPSTGAQPTTQDAMRRYQITHKGARSDVAIGNLPDRKFIVVWTGVSDEDFMVYGQLTDGCSKLIGDDFQVNTHTIVSQEVPSIATLSNGNFVVTWHGHNSKNNQDGIYGQLFTRDAEKSGDEFLANTNTTGTQSISALDQGSFIITYAKIEGGSQEILGQLFFENGTKNGNEFQVNTITVNDQRDPSVASSSNGNFVVTWTDSYDIKGQLFNGTGFKVGNEFEVNTRTSAEVNRPLVVAQNSNSFVMTWTMTLDQGTYGVYGRLFDGSKMNNEFQINTDPADGEQLHSLASLHDGNFVVTWSTTSNLLVQLFQGNGNKIEEAFFIKMNMREHVPTLPAVASVGDTIFNVVFSDYRYEDPGVDDDRKAINGRIFHNHSISGLPCKGRTLSDGTISLIIFGSLFLLGTGTIVAAVIIEVRNYCRKKQRNETESAKDPCKNKLHNLTQRDTAKLS